MKFHNWKHNLKLHHSWQFVSGKQGLFNWFFWISNILFLLLYSSNIVILFLNPHQVDHFSINEDVFLGFYNLDVANNNLYLNWIAYFFGTLVILITAINCLSYWLLNKLDFCAMIRKKEIIIIYLTSVISLVLIFVLNIFNKPVFDITKLNLLQDGWNIDLTKTCWLMQFNYVYDISFIYEPNVSSIAFLTISKFSVIWIIMIIVTFLIYFISLFICLYKNQYCLWLVSRKEY